MRTAPSGSIVHSSSASATGRNGNAFEEVPDQPSNRIYLVFGGVVIGCFILSLLLQPWFRQANVQSQSQEMPAPAPQGYQTISQQPIYSQSNQYGTVYGGVQYAGQQPSYGYGYNGRVEMRVRTNTNR